MEAIMVRKRTKAVLKEELKEVARLEKEYALLVEQTNKAWVDVQTSGKLFDSAEHTEIKNKEDVSYVDVAILNHEALMIRYRLLLKETKGLFSTIQSIKQRIAQP